MMIKTYYLLTKPGIIMGNLITMVAGFFLGSRGHFDMSLFISVVLGLGFVIASACVFNNYIDRDVDKKMERTKNRPFAKGEISPFWALLFAFVLALLGMFLLIYYTNYLTAFLAAIGFFVYVILYSFWKCHSTYATAVGSVAGAIPPVVGYAAASGRFDLGAALFFIVLVLWQMPHFFSIAIYRLKEYTNASIPVMPVVKGTQATKVRILTYIALFALASFWMAKETSLGWVYSITTLMLSGFWLKLSFSGFKAENDSFWAKKMFRFSLLVIMGICGVIVIDLIY